MVTAIDSAGYGAPELRRLAHRYTGAGLAIAFLIHLAGIGAFRISEVFSSKEKAPTPKYSITTLGPPPTITDEQLPRLAVIQNTIRPNVGIPVPVPGTIISPENTLSDQRTMSSWSGPASTGERAIGIPGPIETPADDVPPPIFRAVEKNPEIVKQVLPVYPPLAIRTGLEGTVYVRIWIDKEGKPRKAVVIKTSAEIFNEPAIQAAMQYLFTPALMNKGPVAVWMTIPFVFKFSH